MFFGDRDARATAVDLALPTLHVTVDIGIAVDIAVAVGIAAAVRIRIFIGVAVGIAVGIAGPAGVGVGEQRVSPGRASRDDERGEENSQGCV
jgi:hypothetical protein